jgi:hypothetical protein
MASVSKQTEKNIKRRMGETPREWLSKPDRPVTRGEMWWWLNHWEARRRAASPLYRAFYRVVAWWRVNKPWGRKITIADVEMPKPEEYPQGEEELARKRFDANGRLVDAAG